MNCELFRAVGVNDIRVTGVQRELVIEALKHYHECLKCQEWAAKFMSENVDTEEQKQARKDAAGFIMATAKYDPELKAILDRISKDCR